MPNATNESGTCSGYQMVRKSAPGSLSSCGKSAAVRPAASTKTSCGTTNARAGLHETSSTSAKQKDAEAKDSVLLVIGT